MNNTVDGEYQNLKPKEEHIQEALFGKHPDALRLVENMSDKEIEDLNRGGHDLKKFLLFTTQYMIAKISQLSS